MSPTSKRFTVFRAAIALTLIAAIVGGVFAFRETHGEESLGEFAREHRSLNRRSQAIANIREKLDQHGGEATQEILNGPSQEEYENRAFPNTDVSYDQVVIARKAFEATKKRSGVPGSQTWKLVGPTTGNVPGQVTYTGHDFSVSGRTTALALAPTCVPGNCRLFLGAAGGGVWRTDDALAATPDWKFVSDSIPSTAIGSITLDPSDTRSNTVYVGTGEPNGSSDNEAGVGLYKSTDAGKTWALVAGSEAAAKNRGIGSIAIDPKNPQHLYLGTTVARHGSSSVNGGRFTPPNAPAVGLYESLDGGKTFTLVFSQASDAVNPASPTGADFFRGGVSKIEFDPTTAGRIYFSMFDYGVYRRVNGAPASVGGAEQVFASAGGGSIANSSLSRTEFSLAPLANGKLRIYVGDAGSSAANFYRTDDAAALVAPNTTNAGWTKLSNGAKGTPGFASYNYCGGQCTYDMPVYSPKGQPDVVYIGGQMQYSEIFTAHQPSNGRAVQRSADAGVSFTDMTNDTQTPYPVGMHPDQHAMAFAPNGNIGFFASDGGIVRTSGDFADASAQCDSRGLSNAADLTDCKAWLKAIPTHIYSLNTGLSTIQFQSVALSPTNPKDEVIAGAQDNGTWAYDAAANAWFESVGGDGGQSGIDAANTNIRVHSYYAPQHDVNFRGNDPLGWNWISDPLLASGEAASFYTPLTQDPKVGGTIFDGLQHVWRTKDNGGNQAYLEQHCNEYTGDFTVSCGDWVPIGQDLTSSTFGADKGGSYVVAIERSLSDTGTLWAGTRRGRLFITKNADAEAGSVEFTRIDTPVQPTRFISGIAVDPNDANHAFVSYSGYNAYTPNTPGHVFEVRYNPATKTATWTDISYDISDQPVTDVGLDSKTGTLYIGTDFGVAKLTKGSTSWVVAAPGLPSVATYGLTIDSVKRVVYAATHGRGAWRLALP